MYIYKIKPKGNIEDHIIYLHANTHIQTYTGCPRSVMVRAMDCGIVVREFVLQSRYYVHFRANTLGKDMNPTYPSSYRLNSTTTILLGERLWHLITYKG